MKISLIESDDQRFERIVGVVQGLSESANNAVIFRNTPEVWFQYYLGLYLEKPTFVLIKQADLTATVNQQLNNSLTKLIIVDDFNDKAIEIFSKEVTEGIKK